MTIRRAGGTMSAEARRRIAEVQRNAGPQSEPKL
jgi:hypothetical protein